MTCIRYNACMKSVFISDLHIKKQEDESASFFCRFLESKEIKEAEAIFLLGDIFDLCIGNHKQYIRKYNFFFEGLRTQQENGKKIYFFEGNHDFHLKNVFKKAGLNISYLTEGKVFNFNDKRVFVCHGYEVDYFNKYFKRWYNIYSSKWFSFFVSYILPFKAIEYLGDKASNNSKKRGSKTFNREVMEKKYLDGAQQLIKELDVDGVVCGHTHIQAGQQFSDKTFYYNLGFPVKEGQFLYFDGLKFYFTPCK